VFREGHFLPAGRESFMGRFVVTVLALERAAVSHLDRHVGRDAAPLLALVDQGGKLSVSGCL